jgi:hypothetical protein
MLSFWLQSGYPMQKKTLRAQNADRHKREQIPLSQALLLSSSSSSSISWFLLKRQLPNCSTTGSNHSDDCPPRSPASPVNWVLWRDSERRTEINCIAENPLMSVIQKVHVLSPILDMQRTRSRVVL